MVRVLDCLHFKSQSVVSVRNKPVAMGSNSDLLLVATVNNTVEVFSLLPESDQSSYGTFYSFATIDQVMTVETWKSSDLQQTYIVTLEKKESRHGTATFVRVYFNWQHYSDMAPVKMFVYRQQPLNIKEQEFTSVTLPMQQSPTCLSICDATKCLAVASRNKVFLFNLARPELITKCAEFQFGFEVLEVKLSPSVLAVCSKTIAHAVRVPWSHSVAKAENKGVKNQAVCRKTHMVDQEHIYASPLAAKPHTTAISDDDHCFYIYAGNKADDSSIADLTTSASFPALNQARQELSRPLRPLVVLGPTADCCVSPATLHVEDPRLLSRGAVVTLVCKKVAADDGPLQSLRVSALDVLEASGNPRQQHVVFVCTSRRGFLYDVTGRARVLQEFDFTQPARSVVLTPLFVHAATSSGLLETHTTHHVISGRKPDETHTTPIVTNTSASVINLSTFIGLRDVIATSRHVIVTSTQEVEEEGSVAKLFGRKKQKKGREGEESWTVYALEYPSVGELYRDMVELAKHNEDSNVSTYHHLIREAYFLASSSQYLEKNCDAGNAAEDLSSDIRESAALLGEYCARPDSGGQPQDISRYYLQSGLTVSAILQQLHRGLQKRNGRQLPGSVVPCLYLCLLRPAHRPEEVAAEVSRDVLGLLEQHEPSLLPDVILRRVFGHLDAEAVLDQLARVAKARPEDAPLEALCRVAMATVTLTTGDWHQAEDLISPVGQDELVSVCRQYPSVLHKGLETLSPFAQLLRRHNNCHALVISLLSLVDDGHVTFEGVLRLAGKEDSGNFGKSLLENVLMEPARSSQYATVAVLLMDLYLHDLERGLDLTGEGQQGQRSGSRMYHSHESRVRGHFAKRYSWLDDVSPFTGKAPARTPCRRLQSSSASHPLLGVPRISSAQLKVEGAPEPEVACGCCCCNRTLTRAQSLLCYGHMSGEEVSQIMSSLGKTQEFPGKSSLILLTLFSSDRAEACRFAFQNIRHVVSGITWDILPGDASEWSLLVTSFYHMLEQDNTAENSACVRQFRDFLTVMAKKVPCRNFLQLIPDNVSVEFVLPYVRLSRDYHVGMRLKAEVRDEAVRTENAFSRD